MKKTIFIDSNGVLKRANNTILLETKEDSFYLPINNIENIHILGEISFNKRFLELISYNNINLHFYNYNSNYIGSFISSENTSYIYILNQVKAYLDDGKRLYIAKEIIKKSLSNMMENIKYYKEKIIEDKTDLYTYLSSKKDKVEGITSINELMGIEGNIRKNYYKLFDYIIEDENFKFIKRSKRPPKNNLNSMISFANVVFYNIVLSEIYKASLNPGIGYLHTSNFRKSTLQLDIAEIFKPIVVDRVIFKLINKNMIKASNFKKSKDQFIKIDGDGRRMIIENLNNKLSSTFYSKNHKRNISYLESIRFEIYQLRNFIMEE